MTRFVTIKRFGELTGYSEEAARQKMKRGDWLEGREFRKAPDGRVLMDMEGYEQWVLGATPAGFDLQPRRASSSTSTTAVRAAANA
ncbi:excisionase [Luteimonas saliphila]|uniref:excisionase n=1 Tax=Luteimonas saliphila TaxID=2804919 RepID=UPI00192D34B3|nr:excisionase [Luteimonas saliphila]